MHAIKHLFVSSEGRIRSNARKITLRLSLEYRIDKASYRVLKIVQTIFFICVILIYLVGWQSSYILYIFDSHVTFSPTYTHPSLLEKGVRRVFNNILLNVKTNFLSLSWCNLFRVQPQIRIKWHTACIHICTYM